MKKNVANSAGKQTAEKKKLIGLILIGIGILLILGICIAVFAGNGGNGKSSVMNIKTAYMTVEYPKAYREYLKHEEILEGSNATEVFSMVYKDVEAELFRLSFTQTKPDFAEGYLNMEDGILYVSLSVTGVDSELFIPGQQADESGKDVEMEALYFSMMEGMSTVLESVQRDARYSTFKDISENDRQNAMLSHWEVSLPKNVTWVETVEGDIEHVTFSGNIGDKTVKLYTISLGDSMAESPVGQYVVNGETKIISVEIHDPNAAGDLAEDEMAAAYALMDTVNDVLQVIRQDKNFHDQLEPAP